MIEPIVESWPTNRSTTSAETSTTYALQVSLERNLKVAELNKTLTILNKKIMSDQIQALLIDERNKHPKLIGYPKSFRPDANQVQPSNSSFLLR